MYSKMAKNVIEFIFKLYHYNIHKLFIAHINMLQINIPSEIWNSYVTESKA